VFDRLAATLPSREKPTALAAVRTAIAGVIEATANDPELVRLLRQARELFPESAWVANELGSALHRAGEFDEACVHHARALHLRGQASIHREEYPDENVVPWSWQLANHLVGHFSGENQPGDRRGTPFVQDSIHVTE
jgi:hypothetical protein